MGSRRPFLTSLGKTIAFVFALFALTLLAACPAPEDDRLVLGGVLPLTGDAATFGVNAARGAELAIAEANEAELIPGVTIVWRTEDSRGNPADALSAAQKLITVDRARLLIGDVTSAATHAIIPVITEAEVPLISPSASDPALSGASPYFARVWPSDVYEASVIAERVRSEGLRAIAMVFANTDYGVAMVDEFESAVGRDRVPLRIGVDRETLNYRPTIERIRARGADSVFLVLYPEDYRRFLQHLAEQRLILPILATATFEDPMLLTVPGAERVVFASPASPPEDEEVRQQFARAYAERFGAEPGVLSDTGYDAARILIQTYAASGEEGSRAVMDYIRSLRDYPGASGRLTFDERGDVRKPYALRTVREGRFVALSEEEALAR